MAHPAQRQFFHTVREQHPQHFANVKALDVGSLDVNGSLKDLFTDSDYTGIDIVEGKNVDVVTSLHDFTGNDYDTVISGEMLEHSETYKEDLTKMVELLKPGGLLAISAAGEGRPEHGTLRTGNVWGTSDNYYKNIVPDDFTHILNYFSDYSIKEQETDIYFYGIKKVDNIG